YNRAGATIVLTTHNMDEADELCERIAIIDHGRTIAQGSPAELKASIPGGYLLQLRFQRQTDQLLDRLRQLSGVTEARANGQTVDLYAARGGPLSPAIVEAASLSGAELCDVHISEPSLKNLFLHHTGRSLRQ